MVATHLSTAQLFSGLSLRRLQRTVRSLALGPRGGGTCQGAIEALDFPEADGT